MRIFLKYWRGMPEVKLQCCAVQQMDSSCQSRHYILPAYVRTVTKTELHKLPLVH